MKKFGLLLILIITMVIAAQPLQLPENFVVEPNCTAQSNALGFIEIGANAGFEGAGRIQCATTTVTASSQDANMQNMNLPGGPATNCYYSTIVQWPNYVTPGEHQVIFSAVGSSRQGQQIATGSCLYSLHHGSQPVLAVYSPANNGVYSKSQTQLFLQAVLMRSGSALQDAVIQVKLQNLTREGVNVIKHTKITPGKGGVATGYIDITNLDAGDYDIVFSSDYDGWQSTQTVHISLAELGVIPPGFSSGINLVIIKPQNVSYNAGNILFQVEIKDNNEMLVSNANVVANIEKLNTTTNAWNSIGSVTLNTSKNYYAALKPLSETGYYRTNISATHTKGSAYSIVYFQIGTPTGGGSGGVSIPAYGLKLTTLSPRAYSYELNETILFQVIVRDTSDMLVDDANVTAEIFLNGSKISTLNMPGNKFYYSVSKSFSQKGAYSVHFNATQGQFNSKVIQIFYVGIQQGEENALTVDIITPLPEVYPVHTRIVARAKITDNAGKPIKDANVLAVLGSNEYKMVYDKYGEYIVALPELPEDEYELFVVAESDNRTGQAKSVFSLSSHKLIIELLTPLPGEKIAIEKGDSVTVSLNVYDELGDIKEGADVSLVVVEPDSTKSEMQVYQTPAGKYTTVFYVSQNGLHSIRLTAESPGFVADLVESTFDAQVNTFFLFGWNVETLLNVILIVAILILVAGIFRAVF